MMTRSAKIELFPERVELGTINPMIFGNFIEDMIDHMDAVLAYVLKGMDFEHEDTNGDGVSDFWYPITNGENSTYGLAPSAPMHSGHSQKIKISGKEHSQGGIVQKIPVEAHVDYDVTLYLRASMEIQQITIEIVDHQTQQKLSSARVPVNNHNWQEYNCSLSVGQTCHEAELSILISAESNSWRDSLASGTIWLDHVSMLPSDRVGVVKKKIYEMTRDLNCRIMRIGGNYISTYHWEQGIGSTYLRPNFMNEAWGGWTTKYFGTDEFLHYCQSLQVEPLICVNAGSGTPQEAARWVEYCNGTVETPMGALRAKNGQKEPYGVKYWEIGNEIYGEWQVGQSTAGDYARTYLEFAKAMKVIDPTIKLMSCGDTDLEWNKAVLGVAAEYMDYLTIHVYHMPDYMGVPQETPSEERFKAMSTFSEITKHITGQTIDVIKRNAKFSHIKLAMTEYNTIYYKEPYPSDNTTRKGVPYEQTLENAVAIATNINEHIRNHDMIEIANFSDLVNGWFGGCIRVGDIFLEEYKGIIPSEHVIYGTPSYHVLTMYANSDVANVIESQVECDVFSVAKPKGMDVNLQHLPVLDVVTCLNEQKNVITTFIVNRSLEDVDVILNIQDFKAAQVAQIQRISSDDFRNLNTVSEPAHIVCKNEEIEISMGYIHHTIKAHSIYSFKVGQQV